MKLRFLTLLLFVSSGVWAQDRDNRQYTDRITLKKETAINQLCHKNSLYTVNDDICFNKKTLLLMPKNSVLKFDGGVVGNVTLVGNDTRIEADMVQIFMDDVSFEGSWNVKEAYPEWFGAKADGIADDTKYVQRALSLNSAFVVISKNIRFKLRDLVFNNNTYLVYTADSEIGNSHGPKRKSGELIIYSANSSYPGQAGGGEVNEIRFEGQLHPAYVADIRKDVHGHDSFIAPNQLDNTARVSFQIEDEEIPRAAFHYKSNYKKFDITSGTQIQANRTRIELEGVGIKNWSIMPKLYDFIVQKDDSGVDIAGGFIISQDNNSTFLSWTFGEFVSGKPLYYGSIRSKTKVSKASRIDEGLASLNTTNYKNGWSIGVPASISDAMFTVGGKVYAVNTDMFGNDYIESEPGFGFRYYSGLTDSHPRERVIVFDKNETANRRLYLKNESNISIGMVGACSAFSKLFIFKGALTKSSNSYNIDSVLKIDKKVGKYYIKFKYPLQSTSYSVSLTTEDSMIYACISEVSVNGFVITLYKTGTSTQTDIKTGSIHLACFGGDY